MLIATLGFSVMHICVKFLARIPAHEIILFRSLVSLGLSYGFLRYHRLPVFGTNRKFLILRGVAGVIALTLFFITIQRMPLAGAVTLQHLSPLFTILLAMLLLKERVRARQWLFFLGAFCGVILIKGFDGRISNGDFLLAVLSSFFSGLAYICIRKLRHTDHPHNVVFYFPLIATPVMAVWCAVHWVQPVSMEWFWLILAGLFTQVGQVYMTRSLQAEEANRVTILKYLGIIYALVFGYLIFDETYPLPAFIGIVVILVAAALNLSAKPEQESVKVK